MFLDRGNGRLVPFCLIHELCISFSSVTRCLSGISHEKLALYHQSRANSRQWAVRGRFGVTPSILGIATPIHMVLVIPHLFLFSWRGDLGLIEFCYFCRKKKKVKHLKKKKKKSSAKVRRHLKRASSSSRSSSESSSDGESWMQSSDSDEWVESTATNEMKKTGKQGNHSKQDHRHQSGREGLTHTGASDRKETNRRSRKRTETSPENDGEKADNRSPKRDRVKREKRRLSSNRLTSSRSPSVEREREKERERVRLKERRERVSYDRSPVVRKTSDWASYKRDREDVSKGMHSPQKGSAALPSFHEESLESVLKRIREDSGKGVGDCARKRDASLRSDIDTVSDHISSEKLRSRETERSSSRHFKECAYSKDQNAADVHVSKSEAGYRTAGRVRRETSKSLGPRDQTSGSARDRKPSLVSYEASSDEEKS